MEPDPLRVKRLANDYLQEIVRKCRRTVVGWELGRVWSGRYARFGRRHHFESKAERRDLVARMIIGSNIGKICR